MWVAKFSQVPSGPILPDGTYPDINDGNFRMLLRFRIQGGDQQLQDHFRDSGLKTHYTSPRIQNEILSIFAELIKDKINRELNSAFVWCLLADETTDISNREQLVIVARYISEKDGKLVVNESPVCILDVFQDLRNISDNNELRMSGENISKVILSRVRDMKLPLSTLIAQNCDGASSMSSQNIGVCAKVLEVAPLAFYFHCISHGLNLATSQINKVDVVRNALVVWRA